MTTCWCHPARTHTPQAARLNSLPCIAPAQLDDDESKFFSPPPSGEGVRQGGDAAEGEGAENDFAQRDFLW